MTGFSKIEFWPLFEIWDYVKSLFRKPQIPKLPAQPVPLPIQTLEVATLLEARGETWKVRVVADAKIFKGTINWNDGTSENFISSTAAQAFLTCVNFANQNPRPGVQNFTTGLGLRKTL